MESTVRGRGTFPSVKSTAAVRGGKELYVVGGVLQVVDSQDGGGVVTEHKNTAGPATELALAAIEIGFGSILVDQRPS